MVDVPSSQVVRKGRLQPGRMFLVDTGQGRIVDDDEIKAELASEQPYLQWLEAGQIDLDDLPPRTMLTPQHASVVGRQRLFGYTNEELRLILQPMARAGTEPIGSMGTDTPIAVLSDRPRLLYDYFTQLFAQVTNPPLDAIREELVTSLLSTLGPESNVLEPTAESCRQIVLPMPVIDNDDLAKLLYVNEDGSTPGFRAFAIDGLFEVAGGGAGAARRHRGRARAGQRRHRRGCRCHRALRPELDAAAGPHPVAAAGGGASTTTWCGRRPGPGWAWWWSRGTPARCTTWPCSRASARPPSTRTWPSRPSTT